MTVDLNLLAALDALLDESSVSAAATRLHLSQPAMSRTLARIREATGDPILVRAGRVMAPSPRALAIRDEVAQLVRRARALLSPEGTLVPAELERTFAIRCHDALLPSLGHALLQALATQAPGVTVRFLPEGESDPRTRVDLEIGSPVPGRREEVVARDTLAVAMRKDHPCARGKLSAKRFAGARHVMVSRRGRVRDPLDDALARQGLERRVVASAPTTAAAFSLVSRSLLVTTVGAHTCAPLARSLQLVLRPLPPDLAMTPLAIVQAWPEHLATDRAHAWLRGLTRAMLAQASSAR